MPEILLESGPALIGKGGIFGSAQICLQVLFQRGFVLRKLQVEIGIGIPFPQFSRHFFGDALHFGASVLGLNQIVEIEFAVLHDLHAEIIERLNRSVAGQEIKRPGTERNDFEIAYAFHGPCDRQEFFQHTRRFI